MSRKQSRIDAAATEEQAKKWLASSNALAEQLGADILLFNGGISRATFKKLADQCLPRRRRQNVLLIMTTRGGDPDAAYWIGRMLQDVYDHFTLYVPSRCKSAGTLVALAADELVISDLGELGPLDIQKSKKDSLVETESGLTITSAMVSLQDRVWLAFEEYFLRIEGSSLGAISVQTGAEIAAKLTIGAFAPLYGQIDPKQIGESAREMQIATEYGMRLIAKSKAATRDALERLVSEYPTHGFVIDRAEAEGLFTSVRAPSETERALEQLLGQLAHELMEQPVVSYVSHELPAPSPGAEIAEDDHNAAETEQPKGEGDAPKQHSANGPTAAAAGSGKTRDSAARYPRRSEGSTAGMQRGSEGQQAAGD